MSSSPRTTMSLADVAPRLAAAQGNFQGVAYPGRVDLVTRELVRITSGRLSHCSVCRNLRLQAAIDRGFDESMVAHLDDVDRSDLTDAQKAAVRFAQAFLTDPEGSGPSELADSGATSTTSRWPSSCSTSSVSDPAGSRVRREQPAHDELASSDPSDDRR